MVGGRMLRNVEGGLLKTLGGDPLKRLQSVAREQHRQGNKRLEHITSNIPFPRTSPHVFLGLSTWHKRS